MSASLADTAARQLAQQLVLTELIADLYRGLPDGNAQLAKVAASLRGRLASETFNQLPASFHEGAESTLAKIQAMAAMKLSG